MPTPGGASASRGGAAGAARADVLSPAAPPKLLPQGGTLSLANLSEWSQRLAVHRQQELAKAAAKARNLRPGQPGPWDYEVSQYWASATMKILNGGSPESPAPQAAAPTVASRDKEAEQAAKARELQELEAHMQRMAEERAARRAAAAAAGAAAADVSIGSGSGGGGGGKRPAPSSVEDREVPASKRTRA